MRLNSWLSLALVILVAGVGSHAAEPGAKALDVSGIVTDQFGKPLQGATIEFIKQTLAPRSSTDIATVVSAETLATTTSAADGTFHLPTRIAENDDLARCYIRGGADGRATAGLLFLPGAAKGHHYWDAVHKAPMDRPWLVLIPGRTVRGIVVDDSGKPIGGAKITPAEFREAIATGSDGQFEISGLPDTNGLLMPDLTALEISHPNYVTGPIRVAQSPLTKGEGPWRIPMAPLPATITGTITDEKTKAPVKNATADVYYSRGQSTLGRGGTGRGMSYASGHLTLYADERGHYSGRVPFGPVTLTPFVKDTESDHRLPFAITQSQSSVRRSIAAGVDQVEQDLTLRHEQTISGTVKGASPADFPHLRIDVRSAGPPGLAATFVKKDGSFSIDVVPAGSYQLRIMQTFGDPDFFVSQVEVGHQSVVVVQGHDTTGVEIPIDGGPALDERPMLHGKVLNPDGSPAVLASVATQFGAAYANFLRPMFTDLEGSFSMPDAKLDGAFTLWASDSSRKAVSVFNVASGVDPAVPLEIKLSLSAKITGRLYDEANKPMSNVRVTLSAYSSALTPDGTPSTMSRELVSTQTDEQGNYSLSGFVIPESEKNIGISTGLGLDHHVVGELKPGEELSGMNFRVIPSPGGKGVKPERE